MYRSVEKKAFSLHLLYSIIEGIILGVLALNEFVLVKTLQGGNYQVSFLFQSQHVVFVFSIFFYEILKRTSTRKVLVWVAIVTRLPLFLFVFFPPSPDAEGTNLLNFLFLLIFFVYYMATPIVLPAINQLLKQSYSHNNFGRYFSYATSVNKLIILLVTFWVGVWYDINPWVFRYLYPLLGGMGVLSILLLTRIEIQEIPSQPQATSFKESLREMIHRMLKILRTDIPFRDFEIGFMLYGIAWMSTNSVTTLFFAKELGLNYTSVAVYKNAYNILSIILLPFFGHWIALFDPRKFAIFPMASIGLHILFVAFTGVFPYYETVGNLTLFHWLIPAYIAYGVFAATMPLSWGIGSSYFCQPEATAYYQSLHLTLTGIRSLFAPLLGIWIYEMFGFLAAFLNGVILLILATLWMNFSANQRPKIL